MATEDCCKLVGNLDLGIDGCIISVSSNSNTEIIMACGENIQTGPSTKSVNLTAYAGTESWTGCPSKAGVSIPYVRKYDCENDILYLIFAGQGQSFITGSPTELFDFVELNSNIDDVGITSKSYSASSSSGPATIYMETNQITGYGMTYKQGPIEFDTSSEDILKPLGNLGEDYYLQNFSFDAQPGQLPVVSYSFVKPLIKED